MHENINILFVSAFHAPFIQDDIDALGKYFSLRVRIGHGLRALLSILSSAPASDVVFCWFGSVYAFAAIAAGRLCGVKSLLIVGGVDAARDEELGYGIWLSAWRRPFLRYAFRKADRVLVVDPSLKDSVVLLAGYDGGNIAYLPTGYDGEFWKPMGEKEQIVLTVAIVRSEQTLRRKGIDTLIDAARRLPDVPFHIVGVAPALVAPLRPPANMTFHAPVSRADVLPFYRQAKVYCQPSRREGLPNALCEAMLCGCVPVATEVNGIPTAVGDAGILIPPGDAGALAAAIRRALAVPPEVGAEGRARIVALFPRERRESELVRIIRGFTP